MAESPAALTDPEERGQLRRQQILNAAAACFVREGFHGASIARIAKAAGMSPGNLYHFFPGKEAMIAALVQQRLDQSLALFAEIEAAVDPLQAMLDRVAVTLEQQTDPDQAALGLEILAEAGRNSAVASIVRAADDAIREHLVRLYHDARKTRGLPGQVAEAAAVGEPEAVTEVLVAIFQGLPARAISHPGLDKARLLPVLRRALASLF
ncbi:MAG TPA: TetR family transcriptional regulator [Chromatiaceae bacterium]|nr:TetR family transcriptional regulator [Chromatiaceae bacterium]